MDSKENFLAHLEELRKRIIISLAVVAVSSIILFSFAKNIIDFLLTDSVGRLVFTAPQDVFVAYLKVSIFAGVIISSPVVFFQLWRFVSRALYEGEKKYLLVFWFFSVLFFVSGAAFAITWAIPAALKFLMGFASELMVPMITVNSYVSFVTVLALVFGVVFELPLLISFLAKIGIVTPKMLSENRKYAVLLIFIAAAVLTPPDVVTQLMMGVPMVALYEIGIVFAKIFYKPHSKDYLKG